MFKNYQEALEWMMDHLPMYQRVGAPAFKKDLTNISRICEFLNNPQQLYPIIHIAGTNGKGTTSHMIAAVLQASGLKVGLHTSPHYKELGERAKVNGKLITKREIVRYVNRIKSLSETINPSYFEISVGMAFDHFARHQVDVAVIETGLGGRLDSTNIVQPILSVITGIHYDHMSMLGNTLDAIASEKAGIIKINVPVVIGPQIDPVVWPVFHQKAEQMFSKLWKVEPRLKGVKQNWNQDGTWIEVEDAQNEWAGRWYIQAHGDFQVRNLLTTMLAISVLKDKFFIPKTAVETGLAHLKDLTYYIGRWQWLSHTPRILADSAHNEEGYQWMVEALRQLKWNKLLIVLGIVQDKDIKKMLSILPVEAQYFFCKADIPRGLPAHELQVRAREMGLQGKAYSSVKKALAAAKRTASKNDLIFVGGSTFVVAEVL